MAERVTAGTTSHTIDLFLQDSSSATGNGLAGLTHSTSGLTAYYRKGGTGASTAITLATQTATGAWTSGGFAEIDSTNMPGVYRLDVPNAVIDSAGYSTIYLQGATNLLQTALRIDCKPVPAAVQTIATATAAVIADAVWDEATAGHTTAGTYGGRIVRSINSNVGVQITGSNHIAADVHEFQTDVLTSDATAASFVTEVQAGLATSEALAVVDGIVDQLKSRSGYTMSILAGAISNAQAAAEAYTITLDGTAYGVTYSGLDSSGNRTGATLTET